MSFIVESTLSDKEERQITVIFNRYLKNFNLIALGDSDPRELYINNIQSDGTIDLGTIMYYDEIKRKENKLHVVINFSDNIADTNYDRDLDRINLFYKKYDKLPKNVKRNKIVHELFHAKKYVKPTAAYIKATTGNKIGNKRDYYMSQAEFPIQIAAIIHEINLQQKELYRRSKSGSGRSFWKNRRILLLQTIANLINATKSTEVVIPHFLSDYKAFIDILYRNRNNPSYQKYFNIFKSKLKQLYTSIQNKKLFPMEEIV